MIFTDFGKALSQMSDRRFLRVVMFGVALALVLLFAVYGLFLGWLNWVLPEGIDFFGYEVTWVNDLLTGVSILLMLILSVFLMVPVASLFTGLFLEDVAKSVEAKHYPNLPPVPRIPMSEAIRDSINFFGVLVLVNAVSLLLFFFVGPFAPLLFWAVNGYLLGREYFQMAAMRRVGRSEATRLRKANRGAVWWAGVLMAAPLSIPLINLFVPVLGAATFTHLFHRLNGATR